MADALAKEDFMSGSAPAFDPQLAAAYRLAAEIQELLGPPAPGVAGAREHAERARLWWNEGGPKMAEEREITVPVGRRDLRAVVYTPEGGSALRPAYVYLHGGGFRMGAPRSSDRMLRELASAWGGKVVSLDYVHVPEHVFPEAVEDTAAAYAWLAQHGVRFGIDGSRLAFGGSSAGANISLGAAIQLGPANAGFLRAGAMFVGTYDQDFDTESMHQYGGSGFFPSRAGALATIEQYVPDPALRQDPRVNCLRADLGWMPPLFLAAAGMDVFRDGSRRLAAALHEQGRHCELVEYEGMGHLFGGYTRLVDKSRECVADAAAFLVRQVPA
jgi:acetyl esterase